MVKGSSKTGLVLIGLTLLAVVAGYYVKKHMLTAPDCGEGNRFADFQLVLPVSHTVHGIDISQYQGQIDWDLLPTARQGEHEISFVFIRATMGENRLDKQFAENWEQAAAKGLYRGAYHYFDPDEDAQKQAQFFVETVTHQKGDLPPVLDVEERGNLSASELHEAVKIWLDAVEQKVGVRPIIYSGKDFFERNLQAKFQSERLWIAHYYAPKLELTDSTAWCFWQHHDKGRVNGICGPVDFNVFKTTEAELLDLLIP